MSLSLTLNRFHTCSSVSIVNFVQVNTGWYYPFQSNKSLKKAVVSTQIVASTPAIIISLGQNICGTFSLLAQVIFTTSETKLDYYHHKFCLLFLNIVTGEGRRNKNLYKWQFFPQFPPPTVDHHHQKVNARATPRAAKRPKKLGIKELRITIPGN